VKARPYPEIIRLAEMEALEAWRISFKRQAGFPVNFEDIAQYEAVLKEFIYFVRSTLEVHKKDIPLELFRTIRAGLERDPGQV
jgi:hypothetical protein